MASDSSFGIQKPEWATKKVKDVAIVNGDNISSSDVYDEIEYIEISNVNKGEISDIPVIVFDSAPSRAKRKVKQKDIIISTVRPNLEHYAFIKDAKSNTIASTGFAVITAKSIEPRFLFYVLTSQRYTDYFSIIAEGHTSAYPAMNPDVIENVEVPVPPIEEQKRIAHILGTLDDKIELNRQMNHTLEGMACAIFKSWFVDFDPVYSKMESRDYPLPAEVMDLFPDELIESELGLIPQGWEVKPLDKIANYMNGYAMQKYPPKQGEVSLPVIKIRELRAGSTDDNSNRASTDIPKKYVIVDGDVLFSWSGSLLVTLWTGGKGALNQHLFKVSSNHYPKWFYYLWTNYHLGEFQRIAAGKATTMGHIKRNHLSQAYTVVPNEKAIAEFDKIFRPIIDKVISNSLESQSLKKNTRYTFTGVDEWGI